MSKITFSQFSKFIDSDEDFSDEQINEMFGLFRNNAKLEKLKKERERLKGLSAEKKKELDAALVAWANSDKKTLTNTARKAGANRDVVWDDVLSVGDRKVLARQDRANDAAAKNKMSQSNRYER